LKKVAKRLRQAIQNATTRDYVDALAQLGYTFHLNDYSDTVEANGDQLGDAHMTKIRTQLRDCGFDKVKHAEDAYIAEAYDHRYHPIKDYLTSLVRAAAIVASWSGLTTIRRAIALMAWRSSATNGYDVLRWPARRPT
jgi:predicted P-loop ATPase